MMEGQRNRITRWLRQVLTTEQVDRVLIRHLTIDERQSEIWAVGLQGFEPNEESIASLAAELDDTLLADAAGLGGMQRYIICACLGDALVSRLPLRQVASELRLGDALDSEPPTEEGLLIQLMRHNEAHERLFATTMGQIVGTMGETIERQKTELEKADAIRVEALQRIEALISHEHERKLELQKEVNRGERVQRLIEFGLALAPVVVNRVTGKKVFKEPQASPMKALVRKLFESFTEEQQAKLLGVLSPVQVAALSELFKAASEEPASGGGGSAIVPAGTEAAAAAPAAPTPPAEGSAP
jgi:hypothetical protein